MVGNACIDPAGAEAVRQIVEDGVGDGVYPGAAYAFGTLEEVRAGCVGRLTYDPASPVVGPETLYDLASVTKVVGTTSAAMLLYDDGRLDLDVTVAGYVPDFAQNGKESVKVRNLLLHNSGLIWHRLYHEICTDPADGWAQVCREPLEYPTGSRTEYSCIGFLALYRVIVAILLGEAGLDPLRYREWGEAYEAFLRERLFGPLGMGSTRFNPLPEDRPRCAPTELKTNYRNGLVQGEVHDENACFLGGVSGNAGLFAPLEDVVRFARLMLGGGSPVFRESTVREWTRRQSADSTRGLGWDTKSEEGSSAGSLFSMRSFGHLGFTGNSLWIDPERGVFAVLLSNRVHPTRDNLKLADLRPRFHDAVARSPR